MPADISGSCENSKGGKGKNKYYSFLFSELHVTIANPTF